MVQGVARQVRISSISRAHEIIALTYPFPLNNLSALPPRPTCPWVRQGKKGNALSGDNMLVSRFLQRPTQEHQV